jgi:hypothetical protein
LLSLKLWQQVLLVAALAEQAPELLALVVQVLQGLVRRVRGQQVPARLQQVPARLQQVRLLQVLWPQAALPLGH